MTWSVHRPETTGLLVTSEERVTEIGGSAMHYWVYSSGESAQQPAPLPSPRARSGESVPREPGDLSEALPQRPVPAPRTLVMLHGLRGTHEGLDLIAEHLLAVQGLHPGPPAVSSVVIPDLPGFGDSAPMVGRGHDVAGYAAAVQEFLAVLRAERAEVAFGGKSLRDTEVVLMGHSFGSVLAAAVAAAAPELLEQLILVNTLASPTAGGHPVMSMFSRFASSYVRVGQALPRPVGTMMLSGKWMAYAASAVMMRAKDKQTRALVVDRHIRTFNRFHNPAVLGETVAATLAETVSDYAEALSLPTLLIAGEHDQLAPANEQNALVKRMPDARLEIIPEVGHLVHYEAPRAAADVIWRFAQESGDG